MDGLDLDPDLDGFVTRQVESGRFRDAGDVVRAGLRLLEEQEASRGAHRAALLRQIDAAAADPRLGLSVDAVFDGIEQKHAARTASPNRGA